jgi:hypothetical protein
MITRATSAIPIIPRTKDTTHLIKELDQSLTLAIILTNRTQIMEAPKVDQMPQKND